MLVERPFGFLGGAGLEPRALVAVRLQRFEPAGKTIGDRSNIADQCYCLILMKRIRQIAVDVDHGLRALVSDPGAIRLTDGT